jgi:CubicO group peptidase (beta-lactamase class C family)
MQISGKVQCGFEPVRELFTRSLTSKRDRNAQLCIYVGEDRVVDLWATDGEEPFSPDSLVNVFSSGKSIECILLAMLADKGLLNFAERVATYWPEFVGTQKNKDKDKLTVADVMRHEAGLASLNVTLSPEQLTASALKQNAVGQVLEQHPLRFPRANGSPREYHAITRGWIANEIFRRVEPAGRTMGEFLRDEISTPLDIDVFLDVTDDQAKNICRVQARRWGSQLLDSFVPGSQARRIGLTPTELLTRTRRILPSIRRRRRMQEPIPMTGMHEERFGTFDSAPWLQAQVPSAGAKCSARGLGKAGSSDGEWRCDKRPACAGRYGSCGPACRSHSARNDDYG